MAERFGSPGATPYGSSFFFFFFLPQAPSPVFFDWRFPCGFYVTSSISFGGRSPGFVAGYTSWVSKVIFDAAFSRR